MLGHTASEHCELETELERETHGHYWTNTTDRHSTATDLKLGLIEIWTQREKYIYIFN